MAESSYPSCAERDAHPMAHAPRWNPMVEAYRERYGHYPGCPTQVRSGARDVGSGGCSCANQIVTGRSASRLGAHRTNEAARAVAVEREEMTR